MFIKLTRSGPRRYVQLAESYRDENGRVKQRTIASLGRVEQIERSIDSIVRGLHRVAGRPEPVTPPLVEGRPTFLINQTLQMLKPLF